MDFSDALKELMVSASLNATQLADASGLSLSSISRYLSGKQSPGDKVIRKLSEVLSETLSQNAGADDVILSATDIYAKLQLAANGIEIDYAGCMENLKELLADLEVSNNELARLLSYDPSHISRILGGSRKPSDLPYFLSEVSNYLGRKFFDSAQASIIMSMVGYEGICESPEELSGIILRWLGQPHSKRSPQIAHFLDQLDDFDLNDFKASIHFDEIKVPVMPFQLQGSKTYTGLKEMMQSELDFIKYAVLSKSDEDIILYSDMPMEEMSKDADFARKWMMGMALLIRKGLHLQMIHDVHRPLPEMLLGLEGWIPMYMTGQVHPYYLKEQTNQHFMHFLRSAGTVAISGEAIYGKHENGRYIVTKNKSDVAYYRQRARDLLHRASPLMEIYKSDRIEEFHKDLGRIFDNAPAIHSLGNTPPLFTMSEQLLESILSHNDVSEGDSAKIKASYQTMRNQASSRLAEKKFLLEISEIPSEDYASHPVRLHASWLFPRSDIRYTEEEYRQHIKEAGEFADEHPGFSMSANAIPAFRNIDICISPGRAVLVSKSNPPIIHFLILHPQMISAFEQFVPSII